MIRHWLKLVCSKYPNPHRYHFLVQLLTIVVYTFEKCLSIIYFFSIISDPPGKFLTFNSETSILSSRTFFSQKNRSQLFRFRLWYFIPNPYTALLFFGPLNGTVLQVLFSSRFGNWQFHEIKMKAPSQFQVDLYVVICRVHFVLSCYWCIK